MKLYMHPISTVCRPVRLLIAENKLPVEEQLVDLMTGEHYGEAYSALNPSRQVPLLEDGNFRLTEASAILKYLADKFNLASYPKDLQQRAKVNELMDWINTGFYRDFGYSLLYPQIFPHHKRATQEAQEGTIAWGKERAANWLSILDKHYIGPDKNYLCGKEISIADYFAIGVVTAGEIIQCDFSPYPNVQRWIATMKKLPSWNKINDVFYSFAGSVKDQKFHTL